MKNFILSSFFIALSISINAQIDTVLFENFQLDVFLLMADEPTGDNGNWVNYDEDGLATNLGTEASLRWYGGEENIEPLDSITGITNFVAYSTSFLDGFLPGNRNWMILNAQTITDDSYMLHWMSAPAQLPRYMDGYNILISTNGNELASFTDTLFTAASMEAITGDGDSVDFSNFSFTPGYQHASSGTDANFFAEGSTVNFGLLEPHSVDLSAYSGQTVYIAFLHDSDDDERIMIDDILITKAAEPSSIIETTSNYRMECYPNPAEQFVNLNFQLDTKKKVSYSIFSTQGKLVQQSDLGQRTIGTHSEKLNVSNLTTGNYLIQLEVNDEKITRSFIKK